MLWIVLLLLLSLRLLLVLLIVVWLVLSLLLVLLIVLSLLLAVAGSVPIGPVWVRWSGNFNFEIPGSNDSK